MKKKSHSNTNSTSSSYSDVEYSSERSIKVFAARPVYCSEGDSQEVITWKSARSLVGVHDSNASFTINIYRLEDEENNRKMNNLLRGERTGQILTKNIEK